MNTPQSTSKYNLLTSYIEKLEEEKFCSKEDTVWLKRYLHQFQDGFTRRAEVEEINALKQTIFQLTTQINELQQDINQSSISTEQIDQPIYETSDKLVDSNLEEIDSIESIDSLMDLLDDDDYPIYRRTNNSSRASKTQPKTQSSTEKTSTTINPAIDSTNQTSSPLSDDEFKVERIIWILEKCYLDEEKIKSI